MQGIPGRLHGVFDGWASGGKKTLQGLSMVFFNGEKIELLPIAMVPYVLLRTRRSLLISSSVRGRHGAAHMAKLTYDALDDFGVIDKLLGLAGDNTNTNPAMVHKMEPMFPADHPTGLGTFVGCAGHQIDLGAKVFFEILYTINY